MGKVNLSRVLVGGLLAGLVINVSEFILNGVVIGERMDAAMRSMNLPPMGPATEVLTAFVVLGFALGVMTVWLYAAIRTRFGAGPYTAVVAGAVVWFLAYLYPSAGLAIIHVFPRRMIAIGVAWGLPELVIAAVAGAWAYRE